MPDRAAKAFIAALLVLAIGFVGLRYIREVPRLGIEALMGRKERHVDLAALVLQVRDLSRLETAAMRVMHMSTATQSYGAVPNALGGDSLTFMAVGDVIAGIDLASVRREDVRLEPDGTLVMKLPPPQVLVTRVDNQLSQVVSRKTGVLRRSDNQLESRARAYAETGIRQEALAKGILPMARANAEKKLSDFLHTLGFQKVRFEPGVLSEAKNPLL